MVQNDRLRNVVRLLGDLIRMMTEARSGNETYPSPRASFHGLRRTTSLQGRMIQPWEVDAASGFLMLSDDPKPVFERRLAHINYGRWKFDGTCLGTRERLKALRSSLSWNGSCTETIRRFSAMKLLRFEVSSDDSAVRPLRSALCVRRNIASSAKRGVSAGCLIELKMCSTFARSKDAQNFCS
jgi:hypothetical protein